MAQYLPTGLSIGDTFQIAFLTTDISFAYSGNINDYNAFVQNDWNKYGPSGEIAPYVSPGSDITFKCICTVSGESAVVYAVDNVDQPAASSVASYRGVYRLDGSRCVATWPDLWATPLEHPINIKSDTSTGDPSGSFCVRADYNECSGNVWTGSLSTGVVPFAWWALGPVQNEWGVGINAGHITGVSWASLSGPRPSWLGMGSGGLRADISSCPLAPPTCLVSKHFYALSEVLTWTWPYYANHPATDCYDCGVYNVLGVSAENCCPRPANAPTPLPTDCCPYQYKKRGLIVCYKKTKYNTPYHVSGAQGPAKFRKMPGNYTGRQLRHTRIQRGRWNHSLSNTKLFPIISECRDTNGNLTSVQQSKNIYTNTDYKMPKHELMSYLMRNRKYLHR